MIKIWAKLIKEHKIIKQFVFEKQEKFEKADFFKYISEICTALDISAPLVLNSHTNNYKKFNITTFKKDDFLEEVSFDKMTLENIAD